MRRSFFLVILVMITLAFASAIRAQTLKIRLAHTNPAIPYENVAHSMALVFKEVLEEESQNQIQVEIFPGGQLGNEQDLVEGVQLGSFEAIAMSEGTLVNFFRPLEVLGIPYLFPSIPIAQAVVDGPFGQQLKEAFREKTGLRILTMSDIGGFRNFFNNVRPVRTPNDLAGLKIRVMEHPAHIAMVRALGAVPTPVPYAEAYLALQTGVVDGFELPFAAAISSKLYEVGRYMTVDKHLMNNEMLILNDRWYQRLNKEHQACVNTAARVAQEAGRGVAAVTRAIGIQQLTDRGVQIHELTKEEYNEFRKRAQTPVIEWLRGRVDNSWIDGILSAVEAESGSIYQ